MKYARIHAACFGVSRTDDRGYRRFVKVRKGYYYSEEWQG